MNIPRMISLSATVLILATIGNCINEREEATAPPRATTAPAVTTAPAQPNQSALAEFRSAVQEADPDGVLIAAVLGMEGHPEIAAVRVAPAWHYQPLPLRQDLAQSLATRWETVAETHSIDGVVMLMVVDAVGDDTIAIGNHKSIRIREP